jgi:hypothetical protein
MSDRSPTSQSSYARWLPPQWWIKRRLTVQRYRGGWHASYRWRNETWGVTADTRDEACKGLREYIEGIRDGSLLEEYYAQREQRG